MTNLDALVEELKELTALQQTPRPFTEGDYRNMIIYGVKTLYIDTGRALAWNEELLYEDEENQNMLYLTYDLPIDEEKYVLLCAQIAFYRKVQSSVNNIVSYTTNALSVSGGDKPYAHLKNTIGELENEKRKTYYKMRRYTI